MSNNHIVAVDSLVANEFKVEIDGEVIQGVFRIGNLITFKLDDGEIVREPFELVKMVQRDGNSPFNKWLRETVAAGATGERPKRTVNILAIDDGTVTRRWTAKGARITQVRYSDFDTGSSEMVEEIVTIHYDELEESWPATPDLE